MSDPTELRLADLKEKYEAQPASHTFARLYPDQDFGHMFAVLHKQLNQHFGDINDRTNKPRHYWADNSRDLIALIEELDQDLHTLKLSGIDVDLDRRYEAAIERCNPWLSRSGGSAIPEDFEPIELVKYEPVFSVSAKVVKLKKGTGLASLKMVGQGSYANVFSYVDPDYGKRFALKRAKRGISDRDLLRFRREFEVMRNLSFPYIVEVYEYDEVRNEYRMEFCDETLRSYIARRNNRLSPSTRKRIALQFLYGVNYIHSQNLLHRDISLQNVLLKVYGSGAVLVKLSDFGLVKDKSHKLTRTQTEMRGTIRDPLLDSLKDYAVVNEIYQIGFVLSYIFNGREALPSGSDPVTAIVKKCAAMDIEERYQNVLDLISDVEHLDITPTDAPA